MNSKNKVKNNNLLDIVGGSVDVRKNLRGISADRAIKKAKVLRFRYKQDAGNLVDSKDL